MKNTTEARWRRLIQEQEQSGRTVRAFAADRGLSLSTVYWWRSKLSRRSPTAPVVPAMVEVAVRDIGRPSISAKDRLAAFELQIRGDMTLRIPPGFDSNELRRLLETLQPC